MFDNIRIVLINTSHPGNIGAAARAMKTMFLRRLVLVDPQQFPCAEATARASGADDVLASAMVCASLEEALQGCSLVVGASARLRRLPWPVMDPRQCAERLIIEPSAHEIAIVFGREHSGLTNDELERCHYLVNIPSNPEYGSLNIAAAVQVICYELCMAAHAKPSEHQTPLTDVDLPDDYEAPATAQDMERLFTHLFEVLGALQFLDKDHPGKMQRRLKRLLNRSRPDRVEMNILRGILSLIQKKLLR